MRFRTYVEPAEPMRGLEVPHEVVEALGGGPRPRVTITINGHSWKSRVAIMRGRYLLGLSNANRQAAGVVTGDEVEVEMEVDAEPPVVVEPADFARALDADPVARAAYDRLAYSHKRQHVRAIERAKKPETRRRRIEQALAMLRDREAAGAARPAPSLEQRRRSRASRNLHGPYGSTRLRTATIPRAACRAIRSTATRMPQPTRLLKWAPVVDGEVIWDGPDGYYHHHLSMQQVRAWLPLPDSPSGGRPKGLGMRRGMPSRAGAPGGPARLRMSVSCHLDRPRSRCRGGAVTEDYLALDVRGSPGKTGVRMALSP
jgi:hypothetical protein